MTREGALLVCVCVEGVSGLRSVFVVLQAKTKRNEKTQQPQQKKKPKWVQKILKGNGVEFQWSSLCNSENPNFGGPEVFVFCFVFVFTSYSLLTGPLSLVVRHRKPLIISFLLSSFFISYSKIIQNIKNQQHSEIQG